MPKPYRRFKLDGAGAYGYYTSRTPNGNSCLALDCDGKYIGIILFSDLGEINSVTFQEIVTEDYDDIIESASFQERYGKPEAILVKKFSIRHPTDSSIRVSIYDHEDIPDHYPPEHNPEEHDRETGIFFLMLPAAMLTIDPDSGECVGT